MKQLVLIIALTFFCSSSGFSQDEAVNVEAVNNYKYIIVPLKYEFLSDADQYQINSLTKFLFNKYGYTAFLENDPFPDDLRRNRCLALTADVEKDRGGFLVNKLKINMLDCNGQVVASSKVGKSREKEYKISYNLALRNAFETFQFYDYSFKPDSNSIAISSNENDVSVEENVEVTKSAQAEIERLKQEVAALKEEKKIEKTVVVPVPEKPAKAQKTEQPEALPEDANVLFAQPINHGFQVVDATTKVVMILLETPKADTYIVKDQNAIVYKEDGFWYISKNDGTLTSLEILNIKF